MTIIEEITDWFEENPGHDAEHREALTKIRDAVNAPPGLKEVANFTVPKIQVLSLGGIISGDKTNLIGKETYIEIDANILQAVSGISGTVVKPREYVQYVTGSEISNDAELIKYLSMNVMESPGDLVALALHTISLCLKSDGPLHAISLTGQQNLNLGYALLDSLEDTPKIQFPHVIYLERLDRLKDGLPEFYIHSSTSPRTYKSHRNLLVYK